MPDDKSIHIRPARLDDVPIILALVRDLAEYEKLTGQLTADEALYRRHLFGAHRAAEALLAEVNAKPVAYAVFFPTFSTFIGKPGIWLEDIYVDPAYRGKGVGKALLAEVAAIAKTRGCVRLEWSVLDWNESAIGFYRKLGAQLLPDWRICRINPAEMVP